MSRPVIPRNNYVATGIIGDSHQRHVKLFNQAPMHLASLDCGTPCGDGITFQCGSILMEIWRGVIRESLARLPVVSLWATSTCPRPLHNRLDMVYPIYPFTVIVVSCSLFPRSKGGPYLGISILLTPGIPQVVIGSGNDDAKCSRCGRWYWSSRAYLLMYQTLCQRAQKAGKKDNKTFNSLLRRSAKISCRH